MDDWSSGLAIPGAANLADQASSIARKSGVAIRRRDKPDHTHPVGMPRAPPGEPPACRAIVIGELAIGVEQEGQPIGHFLRLVGAQDGVPATSDAWRKGVLDREQASAAGFLR